MFELSPLLPYQREWLRDRRKKKIWLASRQIGKSFTLALEAIGEGLERKCNNMILSASERQSREVMEKVAIHIKAIELVRGGKLTSGREPGKEEVELFNGSRILSLPSSPDTVRGFSGNVFLDEFAFHKDATEVWSAMYPSITRGALVSIASTPFGKFNLFHDLFMADGFSKHKVDIYEAVRQGLKGLDGKPIDIEAIKRDMTISGDEARWRQEYLCSFESSAVGAYFDYLMTQAENEGRITEVPYDPALNVDTWWDLGVSKTDATVVIFTQRQKHSPQIRVIDYVEIVGTIQVGNQKLSGFPAAMKILKEKPYRYDFHTGPHDLKVHEWGTFKTRMETAKAVGFQFQQVGKLGKMEQIDAARNLIPMCVFDAKKTARLIECLRNHRKAWDEKRGTFLDSPVHDWTSHGADAFMVLGIGNGIINQTIDNTAAIRGCRASQTMAWAK